MLSILLTGNYKVEMYDKVRNAYVPTLTGLGMHVEVRDPEDKVLMSRVRWRSSVNRCWLQWWQFTGSKWNQLNVAKGSHCVPNLYGSFFIFIPSLQWSWNPVYWFYVVCPSVHPSVDKIVSALYLPQYVPDPFHIWQICGICNFDFVLLWHGIWYESYYG